jgi:hypothetical protein
MTVSLRAPMTIRRPVPVPAGVKTLSGRCEPAVRYPAAAPSGLRQPLEAVFRNVIWRHIYQLARKCS